MGLTVGGGVLSVGGVGLLGFHYWDWLLPMAAPAAGTALLVAGGGLLLHAADDAGSAKKTLNLGNQGKHEPGRGEWRLQIVPLNDEARFASAANDIARGSSCSSSDDTDTDDANSSQGATAIAAELEEPLALAEADAAKEQAIEQQRRQAVAVADVLQGLLCVFIFGGGAFCDLRSAFCVLCVFDPCPPLLLVYLWVDIG